MKLKIGDEIKLTESAFVALFKAFFAEIEAKFENLAEATQFGLEYLTYVLWAVSPQGRAVNLGERPHRGADEQRVEHEAR